MNTIMNNLCFRYCWFKKGILDAVVSNVCDSIYTER